MKINGKKALDYTAQGERLELVLAETTMADILGMDTAVLTVETDAGDVVEAFVGFSLASVTYEVAGGVFRVILDRAVPDTTGASLDALTRRVAAQGATQEDIMLALAELAGLVATNAEGSV